MKRKFISQRGMRIARWDHSVISSMIKRQKKKAYSTILACGCSSPDCTFPIIKEIEEKKI